MATPRLQLKTTATHRLLIRGCKVDTWVGVYEHERAQRSTVVFDIDLEIDGRQAAKDDRIDHTVDYALVVADIRQSLFDRRFHLIEAMADFVAQRILQKFGAIEVKLVIFKGSVLDRVDNVGVQIERFAKPCDTDSISASPAADVFHEVGALP